MEERRRDNKDTLIRLEENQKEIMDAINKIESLILSPNEVEYVRLAIINEAKKIAFKDAIIQKTIMSLLYSGILGLLFLLWEAIKVHLK
jgi:ribulose bisphosphate carboxylase small subunit